MMKDKMQQMQQMQQMQPKRLVAAGLVLAAAMLMSMTAFGAQKATTKKKAVVTYSTTTQTASYTKNVTVTAKWSDKLPVLKGKTSVVKKINKAIQKNHTSQKANYERLKEYAVTGSNRSGRYASNDSYYMTTVGKVTYNKNGVLSIRYHHEWYAGGIHNEWNSGETYSLKTGKKMKVTDFLKGGSTKVRSRIVAGYQKLYPDAMSFMVSELKKEKLSKLSFFRKGSRICVCLPTRYGFTGSGADIYLKIS